MYITNMEKCCVDTTRGISREWRATRVAYITVMWDSRYLFYCIIGETD